MPLLLPAVTRLEWLLVLIDCSFIWHATPTYSTTLIASSDTLATNQVRPLPTSIHIDTATGPYIHERMGRAASRGSHACIRPCTRPREIVHVEQPRVEAANTIFGRKLCCAFIQPGIALIRPHIHCPRMCRGHSRRNSWPWCMH